MPVTTAAPSLLRTGERLILTSAYLVKEFIGCYLLVPVLPAVRVVPVYALTVGNGAGVYDIYDNDSNYPWLDQLVPRVHVPHVDTSVRN